MNELYEEILFSKEWNREREMGTFIKK